MRISLRDEDTVQTTALYMLGGFTWFFPSHMPQQSNFYQTEYPEYTTLKSHISQTWPLLLRIINPSITKESRISWVFIMLAYFCVRCAMLNVKVNVC